jgi:hypothetical protein
MNQKTSMKTYAASVGLIALSASVLSAVESSVLNSQQTTKPWSVSAALRGFYDDNINSSPSGSAQESWGVQISPSINYGFAGERTSVNFGYFLAANWYDSPYSTWSGPWQVTQTIQGALTHTFNPRINVNLQNSFVIGQEPDVLQMANTPLATAQQISGDNIRNYAAATLNFQATSLLGFQFGYGNTIFNYDDSGPGSNSALLDRMENSLHLDSRWTLQPQTIGILGYMYNNVNYTGDEIIGVNLLGPIMSDDRNSNGNTIYAGVEHAFTPDIAGKVNAGAQFYDFYNDPQSDTQTTPYIQGSLTYAYRATSSVQVGLSLMQNPISTVDAQGTSFVLNAESLLVYAAWVHEIMPKLYGNLNGAFQQSKYNGGSVDGDSGFYYRVGVSLAYEFTKHFSANVGYNWDQSDTPEAVNQSYDRNRVFFGVTASY